MLIGGRKKMKRPRENGRARFAERGKGSKVLMASTVLFVRHIMAVLLYGSIMAG